MCTAVSWNSTHHYFGRNLDLEYSLPAQVCITPRNFLLPFRHGKPILNHYAMIGAALVRADYPLYFEATNEAGLSMAGLNFPQNAVYHPRNSQKKNIASFELIPWVLSQCKNTIEAEALLAGVQITDDSFSDDLSPTPLHWIISDPQHSIVLESMADGLHIHNNPVGILTNNPPFGFHLYNLAGYRHMRPQQAENTFSVSLELCPYSNGMGAMGLPGDLSSASRFVRAAFLKENSIGGAVAEDISHFFHILDSVAMPRGSVIVSDGRYEITRYSSCCDTVSGIYYYKTYESNRLCCIDLHHADLDSMQLIPYPMLHNMYIHAQN